MINNNFQKYISQNAYIETDVSGKKRKTNRKPITGNIPCGWSDDPSINWDLTRSHVPQARFYRSRSRAAFHEKRRSARFIVTHRDADKNSCAGPPGPRSGKQTHDNDPPCFAPRMMLLSRLIAIFSLGSNQSPMIYRDSKGQGEIDGGKWISTSKFGLDSRERNLISLMWSYIIVRNVIIIVMLEIV